MPSRHPVHYPESAFLRNDVFFIREEAVLFDATLIIGSSSGVACSPRERFGAVGANTITVQEEGDLLLGDLPTFAVVPVEDYDS